MKRWHLLSIVITDPETDEKEDILYKGVHYVKYRIHTLHLHIILIFKMYTDGHCLYPGIICVSGVIYIPFVYLKWVKEGEMKRQNNKFENDNNS